MPLTLRGLLARGYFPAELPPPFTTAPFARQVTKAPATFDKLANAACKGHGHKLARHNLARVGMLRRVIGIPNPAPFIPLAKLIVDRWSDIRRHVVQSRLSRSTPVLPSRGRSSDRAIARRFQLHEQTNYRAKTRAGRRYLLAADIDRFYGSLYTHCVPWAIHTKKAAKADRSDKLWGNTLDRYLRQCQDGQTVGIPIGPDTSLVVAEIVLTAVDKTLRKSDTTAGFRYMDDYELSFFDRPAAVGALSRLEGSLADFEFELNSNKTGIRSLPETYEEGWVSELRSISLDGTTAKEQYYQLVRFSTRAFELSVLNPANAVLNWAIARLASVEINEDNWSFAQSFVIQCIAAEPGSLKFVSELLPAYIKAGYKIDKSAWTSVADDLVKEHSVRRHGSEVAWVLWIAILLNLRLRQPSVSHLADMNDPVVAMVALHAQQRGVIPAREKFTPWRQRMSTEELTEDQWLMVYEAGFKGWLPSVKKLDHIGASPFFKELRDRDVYFYRESTAAEMLTRAPKPGAGAWRIRQLAHAVAYGASADWEFDNLDE